MVDRDETRWADLPIVCPRCGNHGEAGGPWEMSAWTPFKLVEEVVRSWVFEAKRAADGSIEIIADGESDQVDWESGANLRFECMQCFGQFPLPDGAAVDFA
jgi:hypothetical protein